MNINFLNKLLTIHRLARVSLLSFVMITFTTLLFAETISGQTITDTRISVTLENASLKTALTQVEQKSGFIFVYNERLLNPYNNFTLTKEKITVADLLNLLLKKTDLTYQVHDNKVLIIQKEKPKPVVQKPVVNVPVSGKVTDDKG
ncbi:MAG: TonB-dependent receptor plug, partial [Bacteroidota bacterium]|nr:TonB-dependent receptor plug [Bacteroidota bacterium]